ncbi:hypothetical protein TWF281_003874 [Arthrobotrys megalospora]
MASSITSKLFSFPTELHIQILQYLHWSEHFAAAACPVWASVLQDDVFRRQRYVGDFWVEKRPFTNTLSGPQSDRSAAPLSYPRTSREHAEVEDGRKLLSQLGWHRGVGLHKLLGSRTAVLAVKRSGGARLFISRVARAVGVEEDAGDGSNFGRLKFAFEQLQGKFPCYDATDSPLLAEDPQFFPDDEERAELEAKVEAQGNADGEINLGYASYVTDGNKEVFQADDKALECWAIFEAYTDYMYQVNYGTKTHPRRKIFVHLLILKETTDSPERECMRYGQRPCSACLAVPGKLDPYEDDWAVDIARFIQARRQNISR